MLTAQGLGIFGDDYGYGYGYDGLGLYIPSTDFYCVAIGTANYICKPKKDAVKAAFKELQKTVKTIAARMTAAGRITVPRDMTTLVVDGDIGKITSLGVQVIGAAFSAVTTPPAEVAYALEGGISGEETVKRISARAVEIDNWFKYVAANFPEAIKPQPEVVKEIQERIIEKIVYREPIRRFRPIGAIVIGTGLLAIMGLTAASIVAGQRRAKQMREGV